ncbi:MAG: LEA type 2 family protein [Myxococcota bacterium]
MPVTFRVCSHVAIALSVLLLPLACSTAQVASSSTEAQAKLRRVDTDFTRASFESIDLLVVVAVENASRSTLLVEGGDARLTLLGPADTNPELDVDVGGEGDDDEEESDEATYPGIVTGKPLTGRALPTEIPPGSTVEVPVRITMALPSDPSDLETFLSWQRGEVEVEGALRAGATRLSFGGTREIATPVLPRPVLQEAQVASIDAGDKGAVFFRVGIDNPNVFDVKVDAFTWGVTVGGKQLRDLEEGEWEQVPASSVASFEDTVNLNVESYGPEVKALLRQARVPYVVEGKMVIRGVERDFRFEGEMAFAR